MFTVRFAVVIFPKYAAALFGIIGLIIFIPSLAYSGSLTSPANATDATSAMFTIEDIFNRLGSGTTVTKRSGAFTEPSAAPASTGHTLDDVMTLVNSRARALKTGQTGCWDAAGSSVACGGTGQDGDTLKGVTWPNPRFTIDGAGTGTVVDNLTTLIWLRNANCANVVRNWATALTDVASLNSAGTMNSNSCGDTSNSGTFQTDWRLPNVMEFQSLAHYGVSSPSLPNTAGTGKWTAGNPFNTVQSSSYWSSTTRDALTTWAFDVNFSNGSVDMNSKTVNNFFVWCVRGGP